MSAQPASWLTGRRVLVPRGGAWGERVRALLAERGADAEIVPLIQTRPPRDTVARDRAFAALSGGSYAWVFVTSAAAIEQLVAEGVRIPPRTRIAVVGHATARAVIDAGFAVDFVPTGASSAAAMTQQWCTAHVAADTGRALVLRSDLAMATVSDELEVRGFAVDVAIAYRTVGVDLPEATVERIRAGAFDATLLTSTSVVRELAHQVVTVPTTMVLAALGPGTAREAERRGYRVAVTAATQTVTALVDALNAVDVADRRPLSHTSTFPDTETRP
ncbi:hypothetical protein GCM10009808_13920 [Microbacterium sediminicola]|uniref:Uroporphyrinogen-III synthase n=1 Tax=Microbacterium sediminicola TaxID=415210 RepID=A0ABP4U226_9MICO